MAGNVPDPTPLREDNHASNGMAPSLDCKDHQPPDKDIVPWSDLGWPCAHGGSVAVTAATAAAHLKNCMVWYNARHPVAWAPEDVRGRAQAYDATIATCERRQPRLNDPSRADLIDLSALAVCVRETYSYDEIQRTYLTAGEEPWHEVCNLRGVAVVPADATALTLGDVEGFGLSAIEGHLLVQRTVAKSADGEPLLALFYLGFLDLLKVS